MIGLLILAAELVRGAHAPRVLAMAPSPSRTFESPNKNCFGEGAETSRRGACAPQNIGASRRHAEGNH